MDVDIDSLETLNMLTREGAQEASDALEEMVDTDTIIDVTKLMVADKQDITADIHSGSKDGVKFTIEGELSGTLLFTFDQDCIDTVTQLLVGAEVSDSMARSSVQELANIMMGGFMAGWGDHLETGLDASPPDYLEAPELDAFEVDSIGPDTDSVLAFESKVKWRDNTVGIDIYLIPDRESIETVLQHENNSATSGEVAEGGNKNTSGGAFGFGEADNNAEPGAFGGGDEDDGDDPFATDSGGDAFGGGETADADDGGFGMGGADSAADDGDAEDDPFGSGGDGGDFGFGGGDDADDEVDADDDFGFDGFDDDEGAESISLDKLSVFSDLTREGTEAAAQNVTMMTDIETDTEIAGISFTPVEDIPEFFHEHEFVGTTCEFEGTPSGYLVIMFDEGSAKNIAEAMMPMEPPGDGDGITDMHASAIEELGNIMTSGFIDGWANVLQTSVEHTPPEFTDDMESEFMTILTEQLGQFQRHAFTIESEMQTEEIDFNCRIHAFPDESELEEALNSLLVERREETQADPSDLF